MFDGSTDFLDIFRPRAATASTRSELVTTLISFPSNSADLLCSSLLPLLTVSVLITPQYLNTT